MGGINTSDQQWCALCAQLAFLAILGYHKNESPERVQLDAYPTGISERTVFKHIKEHDAGYRRILDWANLNRREKSIVVKELNASQVRKELETFLGEATAQLLTAIKNGDVGTAIWLIEQSIGKPAQKHDVKHGGGVAHVVFNPRPVRELAATELDLVKAEALLKALPEGVLEAEVVEN